MYQEHVIERFAYPNLNSIVMMFLFLLSEVPKGIEKIRPHHGAVVSLFKSSLRQWIPSFILVNIVKETAGSQFISSLTAYLYRLTSPVAEVETPSSSAYDQT